MDSTACFLSLAYTRPAASPSNNLSSDHGITVELMHNPYPKGKDPKAFSEGSELFHLRMAAIVYSESDHESDTLTKLPSKCQLII